MSRWTRLKSWLGFAATPEPEWQPGDLAALAAADDDTDCVVTVIAPPRRFVPPPVVVTPWPTLTIGQEISAEIARLVDSRAGRHVAEPDPLDSREVDALIAELEAESPLLVEVMQDHGLLPRAQTFDAILSGVSE